MAVAILKRVIKKSRIQANDCPVFLSLIVWGKCSSLELNSYISGLVHLTISRLATSFTAFVFHISAQAN